jgi:20S proteasome alpha/beta subunit
VNRLASALEGHPQNDPIRLDNLLEIVESARFAEHKARLNGQMKKHLKMTLKQWQALPSSSPQYRRGKRLNNRYWLPVEFLVGGIIRGIGCFVYFIPDEDEASEESLICIGTGGPTAYDWLMKRSQEVHMSLPRTLVHVAEAMREARLKNPKTVGEPADYLVITAEQTRRMPAKHPALQQMLSQYAAGDTEEIDRNDEIQQIIQSAMYKNASDGEFR